MISPCQGTGVYPTEPTLILEQRFHIGGHEVESSPRGCTITFQADASAQPVWKRYVGITTEEHDLGQPRFCQISDNSMQKGKKIAHKTKIHTLTTVRMATEGAEPGKNNDKLS